MTGVQSFYDWREADRRAEKAQQSCNGAVRAGLRISVPRQREIARLRACATAKLQQMVTTMKAAADACRTR